MCDRDEGRLDAEHFADALAREHVGGGAGRGDAPAVEQSGVHLIFD